jgi:hypothetical protein
MKKQSTEMEPVRQKRFTSPNPDLGRSNSIPRCEEYDLTQVNPGWRPCDAEECNYRVPRAGNCVRKDGLA